MYKRMHTYIYASLKIKGNRDDLMTDRAVARCCCRCWLKSPSSRSCFPSLPFFFPLPLISLILLSLSLSLSLYPSPSLSLFIYLSSSPPPFLFFSVPFVLDKELVFSSSSRSGFLDRLRHFCAVDRALLFSERIDT